MYLALNQQKNTVPLEVQGFKKKIHSYEGFCYMLFEHPESFLDVVGEGKFIDWIGNDLGLASLADNLRALWADTNDGLSKMLGILKLCPFVNEMDLSEFEERYNKYVDAPVHVKYQLTGNKHFSRGDYVGALSWYKSAQAIQYSADVANNMAVLHMYNNEFEKARKILDTAIKQSDRADIRLNLVRLMLATGDYSQVLSYLEEMRRLSDDGKLWYYYGKGYEGLEKDEEALASYMRCYDLTKSKDAYEALTHIEIKMGLYDQAEKHIAHDAMPEDKKDYMYARLHYAREKWTDYEIAMEKAIEVAVDRTPLLLELCGYHLDNSQVIKAIEYIALVEDKDQHDEQVRMMKAMIAHTAGNQKSFTEHVDVILNEWKKEVRSLAGNKVR